MIHYQPAREGGAIYSQPACTGVIYYNLARERPRSVRAVMQPGMKLIVPAASTVFVGAYLFIMAVALLVFTCMECSRRKNAPAADPPSYPPQSQSQLQQAGVVHRASPLGLPATAAVYPPASVVTRQDRQGQDIEMVAPQAAWASPAHGT